VGNSVFSAENRNRLFYLVGDLLEKPLMDDFGGFEGPRDFFVLDELLRRRLGKLQLVEWVGPPESILKFIQSATEDELLDLIELVPRAKLRAGGTFRTVTSDDLKKIMSQLNAFLKRIDSVASFQPDGTLNRDGFVAIQGAPRDQLPRKESLERDLRALVSVREPTGLVLFDLDGFKVVNERNGYPAGDKCLDAVVDLAFESIARKGKLYRFREGDEFAATLRNAATSEARATAERIREHVERGNPGGDVRVTASLGVASTDQNGINSAEKLLEAAEDALHVSKHTTKNCVTAWPVPDSLLAEVRERRNKTQGRTG